MATSTLAALSNDLADLTAAGAASVVQVSGARRPASGIVHGADTIITTARAIGREDGLQVRLPDDTTVDADLAGWDPSSGIALLRSRSPLNLAASRGLQRDRADRQIALALARSWSNVITASAGIVAVVGGPLRTGRRRQLERVIRITAPLHDGFAGGAVFDASGTLLGIATAAQIRGYAVVIPASIAWASACTASRLRHAAARLHRRRGAGGRASPVAARGRSRTGAPRRRGHLVWPGGVGRRQRRRPDSRGGRQAARVVRGAAGPARRAEGGRDDRAEHAARGSGAGCVADRRSRGSTAPTDADSDARR